MELYTLAKVEVLKEMENEKKSVKHFKQQLAFENRMIAIRHKIKEILRMT
jgi:hypothetical protein